VGGVDAALSVCTAWGWSGLASGGGKADEGDTFSGSAGEAGSTLSTFSI